MYEARCWYVEFVELINVIEFLVTLNAVENTLLLIKCSITIMCVMYCPFFNFYNASDLRWSRFWTSKLGAFG